jgi:hypothetical protein
LLNSILKYPECLYDKKLLTNYQKMSCGISMMGLFMAMAGLAAIYGITTFGPKLSLQNKTKAMKAKMKELLLAHNNQIIS